MPRLRQSSSPFYEVVSIAHLVTPDGRYFVYFVVRGRLWRCSNPALSAPERSRLTLKLMAARRAKGVAMRAGDAVGREAARSRIDAAKLALGERGVTWWTDGSPDLNRRLVANTPYAEWWSKMGPASSRE